MDYRKILANAMIFTLLATSVGCNDSDDDSNLSTDETISTTEIEPSENTTEIDAPDETEADTTEKREAPTPVGATDDNSVTFDDGEFGFASIISDEGAAQGELSVVDIQGNKMLKFTDSGTTFEDEAVQKIKISAVELIGLENLDKVNSISFDLYADAIDDKLVTENGANVKAPGWIGGGGGTVVTGEEWYDFSEFSIEEYDFEMSGACHVEFKFLLALGGKKWSNDMEDANFVIMRWGLENSSNLYIDNITFYDENGASIPLS